LAKWAIVVAASRRSKEDYGLLKKMISLLHISPLMDIKAGVLFQNLQV